MTLKIREAKTEEEIEAAKQIRIKVFVEEQTIPLELEIDDQDSRSHHVIAVTENSEVIGTGRLTPEIQGNKRTGTISRIAILPDYRMHGTGQKIIQYLESISKKEKLKYLSVKPHLYLKNYYSKLGYEIVQGKVESVVHHQLIVMQKILS